jgi:predicted secreted hydrolase
MRLIAACLVAFCATAAAQWRMSEPGWQYEFPRDHGSHRDFKTEWWYFTGNLRAADGREFGYQLTFFRQGIARGDDLIPLSRFVTRDIKFAHFTVSDLASGKFHFFQKISRGAYGEAGFGKDRRLAWIEGWSCEGGDEGFTLRASEGDVAIDLNLRSAKPPVFHGVDGISRKGAEPGRASHYYSLTRLETSGTLRLGNEKIPVSGESWFDHEWASNQLGENQVGWDWFSLQFSDGSELMLFQLRAKDGTRDPHSAGTFVDSQGRTTGLTAGDFTLEPAEHWKSPGNGASYPTVWRLGVKSLALDLDVRAAMENQELALQPITYWEGAVRAQGTRGGQPVQAKGYLEMTGYAGAVRGMQEGR